MQSIEDQISRLEELSRALNIEIKEKLTEAKSAKKPNCRPIFAKMLERIEKGEAQGILCWQINRLSRNPVDSGAISWMLQQGVIKSIQTIDRQYLPDDNVLLFNVESGMANQFIIDLRKSSRRGMEGKAERGWMPSNAPLGYRNDKLEHTIVEDPERFHLVRKMWDLMLTGNYTPPQIMQVANREWGFRTPKVKRRGGGPLAKSVAYRIFTNIFYTGMFEWAEKIYSGNHKPMITMEEYDRVQFILGKNGKPRSQTHEFAYTGIVHCEECGSMYTASEKTKLIKSTGELKNYVYYHCTRKKKDGNCTQRNPLTLKEMEGQIEKEIEGLTILPEFLHWALETLNERNDREIEERTKVYEMQHKDLSETQKEIDELTKMRYRKLIDDEDFAKERTALKDKIARLKNQLRETEDRAEKWLELTEKTFRFATYARKAFMVGSLNDKREILTALGQNFSINTKKLTIQKNSWLVPIEKAYPELEARYKRLEPEKNLAVEERNAALASIRSDWGPREESNLQLLLRRESFYPLNYGDNL